MSERVGPVPVCYFADTGQPVPVLMTEAELVRVLRLDEAGIKNTTAAIKRYRELGLLRAVQVSKPLRYYLGDVLTFIERQREANPR